MEGSSLGFLSADASGGLRLARFDNARRETLRGQRLLNLCALFFCAFFSLFRPPFVLF